MTKLNKSKFSPIFGDWWEYIEPFFDEGGFDPIFAHLRNRTMLGREIAPKSPYLFRCFRETNYKDLRVLLAGMSPYHTKKNGQQVADGLCMSNSLEEHYIPPSLDKFYEGIENEFYGGICLECIRIPSLSFLASQGVLMYNVALTTEIGVAGAHMNIWIHFSTYLFEKVIPAATPIVLLGEKAKMFAEYTNRDNTFYHLSHPASAAYKNTVWSTEGTFGAVNKTLEKDINWIEKLPF